MNKNDFLREYKKEKLEAYMSKLLNSLEYCWVGELIPLDPNKMLEELEREFLIKKDKILKYKLAFKEWEIENGKENSSKQELSSLDGC